MKPRIFLYLFCFLAVFLALVNAEEKVSVYGLELSLKECVYLALENNDTLKDAYINRKIQKLNFQISEETFFPKIFFSTSGGVSKSTGLDYSFSFNPGGSLKIPTGGSFSFSWANSMSDAGTDYASSMSLSFSQPLLKGMGIDVATASMTKARINEKINILNLKTTITDTVSSIISTYYSLLKAQRAVIDSEEVFQKAQKTLKTSQLLLKMGRIAKVDIFQTEADVANQELAYVAAKASLEEAQTDLLDELELVSTLNVVVKEELELIEPENLDFDYLWSIAQNRPAYQIARLNFEKDKISYIVDKNNQLWDLSLSASISNSGSAANYQQAFTESARFLTEGSWNVLLSTSYDFDNLSEQATAISIEHTWQKSQRTLEDAKKALHTEIEARIREVKAGAIKLKLATRSRELAEKFVKIEQDKLKQGLTTNFKVIALQKNLKEAREVGLDAKFAYFNTLVSLDKSLGATLNTWGIEFKEQ